MFQEVIGQKLNSFIACFNFKNVVLNLAPPAFSISAGGVFFNWPASLENYYRKMWWRGFKKSGFIGTYSQITIEIKKSKNLPFDRVTLFDTGSHYKTIKISLQEKDLKLTTKMPYVSNLIKKYGEDILFLHSDELKSLTNDIKKTIFKILENSLK